jgi:3-oxoacyl-[acyl-carrier protein] reductase
MNLEGKICIITGATRGIGLTSAKLLAQKGAHVFINGRDENRIKEVVQNITSEGYKADIFHADLEDYESIKKAFQAFFSKTKKLDILVNNAGILDDSLIGMVSKNQVEKTFAINTFGTLYMCQLASRLMSKGNSGSIINITSIIGVNGNSGQAVYGGSKAAVIGITKSLAKELAPKNIRVNAIAPGFINTDMASSIPNEIFQKRIDSVAMQRIGEPIDIANSILFFSSDLSTYVTGQTLGVDGGMLI